MRTPQAISSIVIRTDCKLEPEVQNEVKEVLMDKAAAVNSMIQFIETMVLRDPSIEILEDTPLVSSGLVDSFALVEVLLHLEKITNRKISAGDVSPSDLDSVGEMLLTAEKVGKAR